MKSISYFNTRREISRISFFLTFSGLEDGTVVIWHVTENRFQKLDGGHSDAVTRVSFSPNGQYLASLDNEEKLIIWSTQVLLGQILLSL